MSFHAEGSDGAALNIVLDNSDATYAAAYAEGSRNESASLQNLLSIRDDAIGRLIAERDAFTDALAGMVRLHCPPDFTMFEVNAPETIVAVQLLADAGKVEIVKDYAPSWVRARWVEQEEANAG